MAINIVSLNGLLVLKKIGIDQALIDKVQTAEPPVKVLLKNTTLSLQVGGEITWVMQTTTAELLALQKDQLPAAKKALWLQMLTTAITSVVAGSVPSVPASGAVGGVDLAPPPAQSAQAPKAAKAAKAAEVAPLPEIGLGQVLWAPVSDAEIGSLARVKLGDATRMYQPVFGTNSTSRYFVVAGSSKLKVAARYKDKTLSVRAEGSVTGPLAGSLKSAGFHGSDDGHYSVHFEIGDVLLATKTLGALLLATGHPFDTALPQLSKIIGKGH